jgi:tagatose-1,6-bisphosphate aldolase
MKKKAKIKTVTKKDGKLVSISFENHLALKILAAKYGEKMEKLANEAIQDLLKKESK